MEEEPFPLTDFFSFDIRPYTELRIFTADEIILQEGEKPQVLYYLVSGRAKLYLTHGNGRITLINFLNGPCFIGEMELLDDEKRADGVKAISECACYVIHIDQCRQQILTDAVFLRHLCCFLSRKAAGNTANYARNQSYPLKSRLAAFILEASHGDRYREQHTEVAEYLGVTYRHLLYVFAELVKAGALEKTKSGYHILDAEQLRRMQD